jgi:hypothetical protein
MSLQLISRRRTALAVATVGAVGAIAAPSALAQAPANSNTVSLKKAGNTSLTLDKGTAKALTRLGIAVKPLNPAAAKGRTVRFPITGGSLDPKSVSPALITHSGGLRLSHGKTKVDLRNFIIRVNNNATLSAAIGGGKARATIIKLDLSKAKISRPRSGGPAQIGTKVSKVGVKLNKTGAQALNQAFHTTAFKAGLKLGTAVVDARPKELIIETGTTALTLDAATANLLTGAGITPGIIAPGSSSATGVLDFPITRSVISTTLGSGTIGHTGGISLTKGATTLALTDFDIKLAAANTLAASVNGASPKVEIVNLDLSGAQIKASGPTGLVISGVKANLNEAASNALTATFGTPSTTGAPLGTVIVTAQAR